jgi:hypothetical protein
LRSSRNGRADETARAGNDGRYDWNPLGSERVVVNAKSFELAKKAQPRWQSDQAVSAS